jgi:hypothetical protein
MLKKIENTIIFLENPLITNTWKKYLKNKDKCFKKNHKTIILPMQ